MLQMLVRRLVSLIPTLLLVTFTVYLLLSLVPGDPALTIAGAGGAPTPEAVERVREEYHLDDPFFVQYGRWAWNAVQLDLGSSAVTGTSVSDEIISRLPITISIAFWATVVALVLGTPLGIWSGLRPGGKFDRFARVISIGGVSIPNFWLAIVLCVFFAVKNKWLPAGGYVKLGEDPWEWFKHLVLPALTLGMSLAGVMQRQLRAAVIDVIGSKYITAAWARGGSPRTVVGKHALKNAAIPPITVLGLQVGYLIGGTVITEQVFAIPGLGTYMLRAIINLDMAVVQGVTLVFVLTTITMSLVVDLVYGLLNPKVRGA